MIGDATTTRGELYIVGGLVMTAVGRPPVAADLRIRGGRIDAIGPGLSHPRGSQVIAASGRLVLPGLVNGHTHAHSALGRGIDDGWRLEQLLLHAGARISGRDPATLYISAALNAIEMVERGVTAAYDMVTILPVPTVEALAAVGQAYGDVGMRAVIAPAVADIPFAQSLPQLQELLPSALRRDVDRLARADLAPLRSLLDSACAELPRGLVDAGVAPSIPTQCSDALLAACVDIAATHGCTLHTHLAETRTQAVRARDRWGRSLVEHLRAIGALHERFIGAHAIWLESGDIAALLETGAHVVHNPASNAKLGSGTAPIARLLGDGIEVALGTDGSMSSDNQNMFEAMRLAAFQSRTLSPDDSSGWLDARTCLSMATTHGSRLVPEWGTGGLEVGAPADLVVLDPEQPELVPIGDPEKALVFASTGTGVETVVVDGRVVVRDGCVTGVDRDRIFSAAREAAERETARAAGGHQADLLQRLEPYVLQACALTRERCTSDWVTPTPSLSPPGDRYRAAPRTTGRYAHVRLPGDADTEGA